MKFYMPTLPSALMGKDPFRSEPSTELLPNEHKTFRDMVLDARSFSHEGNEILKQIARDPTQYGSTRIAAVRELQDRAWGRPVQSIMMQGIDETNNLPDASPYERLTVKERQARAIEVLRMLESEKDHLIDMKEVVNEVPDSNELKN